MHYSVCLNGRIPSASETIEVYRLVNDTSNVNTDTGERHSKHPSSTPIEALVLVYPMTKTELTGVVAACKVLLRFLLQRLERYNENCAVSQKNLMVLIGSLCSCKSDSGLPKADVVTFTALLKSAKIPPTVKVSEPDDSTEPKELKRPRLDTGKDIFSLLTSVFDDVSKPKKTGTDNGPSESVNSDGDTTIVHMSDTSEEVRALFASRNVISLQQLNGGDILLDVCVELVYLKRYLAYYQDCVRGGDYVMPTSMSEAMSTRTSLQSLLNDISIVTHVFALPLLEPMTPARLHRIVTISMSCLYAAVTAATATAIVGVATGTQMKGVGASKDEEIDGYAAGIVEKALDIFKTVTAAICSSKRAGGHNLQNLHMLGAWCLLKGLDRLLSLTPSGIFEKNREAMPKAKLSEKPIDSSGKAKEGQPGSTRPGSWKGHSGFGVLAVALSSQAISLMTSLMEDLELEGHSSLAASEVLGKEAGLDIFGEYMAIQRVQRLLQSVDVCNLLFPLLSITYKKLAHRSPLMIFVITVSQGVGVTLGTMAQSGSLPRAWGWVYQGVVVRGDPGHDAPGWVYQGVVVRCDLGHDALGWVYQGVVVRGDPGHDAPGWVYQGVVVRCDLGHDALGWVYQGVVAVALKKAQGVSTQPSEAGSTSSESNTFYEDDFSSSDDNSEDDDSEPILGQWFEQTLSPSEDSQSRAPTPPAPGEEEGGIGGGKHAKKRSMAENASFVPDKKEPHAFLCLAADILHFITCHLLGSSDTEIKTYMKKNLAEQHMVSLAVVIREVDRDSARLDTMSLYGEYSAALSQFTHSLVATEVLSDSLQESLLCHLGVNPTGSEAWPCTVHPHTLAVLAEVLLLQQQKERVAPPGRSIKNGSEAAIINIWSRLLTTLQTAILGSGNSTHDVEDVNVEHMQLLLFLFHGLPLMQKKSLLLRIAELITNISETLQQYSIHVDASSHTGLFELVPLPLSRLVLIIDYLLHNFYDSPAAIVQQVQWNLFGVFMQGRPDKKSPDDMLVPTYYTCCEVEDSYTKNIASHDGKETHLKPRFYNLAPTDLSNQDTPKIDGLACSFLLSNPESVDYNGFYDACVTLLAAGTKVDKVKKENLVLLDACSLHYHFVLMSRLLGCLPPSVRYLQQLESNSLPPKDSHILHTLRWVPRLAHKAFQGWAKDYLVKQGLTTQKADALMSSVIATIDSVSYDVQLAQQFIQDQIAVMPLVSADDILPSTDLPSLSMVYMLDAVIAKIQVTLDDLFTKSMADTDPHKAMDIAHHLLPATLLLIENYSIYSRSCLLNMVKPNPDNPCPLTKTALKAYGKVLSIGCDRPSHVATLCMTILGCLPHSVHQEVDKWGEDTASEFPAVGAWRNAFANDIVPVENYIEAILSAHLGTLCYHNMFTLSTSLKHVLLALVRFCSDLIMYADVRIGSHHVHILQVTLTLERVLGPMDEEKFSSHTYQYAISVCHDIVINHSSPESNLGERALCDSLGFMEMLLDVPVARVAMTKFYTEKADLASILLSSGKENVSLVYSSKVLRFFTQLFQLAEKHPQDKGFVSLCGSLGQLAQLDMTRLQEWLSKTMVITSAPECEDIGKTHECHLLLQKLASCIVKDSSLVDPGVPKAILTALIPMGTQVLQSPSNSCFCDLMVVMRTLAGAGDGAGHVALFQAAIQWLEQCKTYLAHGKVVEKLQDAKAGKHQTVLDSACFILSYIADILGALKQLLDRSAAASPAYDGDTHVQTQEGDIDWAEELVAEEDDSTVEDSDEESLNNKLCTFVHTQKDYMNQHWYHCYTCNMFDGIGICSVCAKVCHKDHEVSYAKYSSFFCDCGAKEDGSCQALVKRHSQGGLDSSVTHPMSSATSPFSIETMLTSSLRRRLSLPTISQGTAAGGQHDAEKVPKACEQLCKQIEASTDTGSVVLELLQSLMPNIVENYQKMSPVGSTSRALQALNDLKTLPKTIETTDQLMTATLGSQEGAFENVRMNYSGDQGQTMRQLISSHMLRRVAMCCLSSPHGKRQHLAVSHEKGKVTILQLSALLRQADSSKRKLTLTRLASAPIPFTVLSITGNPCNEDFLAVSGLKDCHVLTFSGSGSVVDHLVLHPSLETGNFIIKAIWLPGSQTELAIITADFVKIYNLSQDAISPQYYFLLPSGKIRDATFVFMEEGHFLLLMASSGYIYTQQMEPSSSAEHGLFYITNILEAKHSDIKEANGQVVGGGVSIYYSHTLQLLFFSYAQGKTFSAAVPRDMEEMAALFPVTFKSSGTKAGSNPQPLVQWMEVTNHPGLVCCMTQTSNNPVILMVKPDTILVQEIRVTPPKAKIQDMVAIRHMGSNSDQRTTLILLCEDGSLRIYMANVDQTKYWMLPTMQPHSVISVLKPVRKKKVAKAGRTSAHVSFPIDFFEHCQQTNDIEYGGNDILQIYNTAQVKHRLNTTGLYIASTKSTGFTIEITNLNSNNVMVGLRILVGSQSLERLPSYFEIFGRTIQINTNRVRWYDMPFTREESLTADKKVTVFVGAGTDPAGITMVDSIKVYTRTKEAFSWPEDSDQYTADNTASKPQTPASDTVVTPTGTSPLMPVDRLLASCVEVLDGCFVLSGHTEEKEVRKQTALELATRLLALPTPSCVQLHTKALLASLFTTRQFYHTHKDQAQLAHVVECLSQSCQELDAEAFHHLVLTARSIAVVRPANLVKFAEQECSQVLQKCTQTAACESTDGKEELEESATVGKLLQLEEKETCHFVAALMEAFWRLHASKPTNPMITPVCLPGLTEVEATVGALVEIIHAFASCDLDSINLTTKLYVRLLLSKDQQVSFACKASTHPSVETQTSPSPRGVVVEEDEDEDKQLPTRQPPPTPQEDIPQQADDSSEDSHYQIVEPPEPMVLVPPDVLAQSPQVNALEALLEGSSNFHAMLDMPPDADDERMVELAIALSLQEQSGGHSGGLSLQAMHLGGHQQSGSLGGSLDVGSHLSDTTASAPGSDDEIGSTAATDGSTLRTSPAEHAGSAGSESGGSNVDSVSVSGRSSAYGDTAPESATTGARSETSSVGMPSSTMQPECCEGSDHTETDFDTSSKLHALRLALLQRLVRYLPGLREIGGMRTIPFMQVVLMLMSDIDSDEERDKATLDSLLVALMSELNLPLQKDAVIPDMSCRSYMHEMQLVVMRLFSVLMSRTKTGSKPSSESASFISTTMASTMIQGGTLSYCLQILTKLLDYWKKTPLKEEGSTMPGQLLKQHPALPPPDMSPFFLRQYVKGHANDVFEDYPQLLTEMMLRLPYQVKKIAEGTSIPPVFDQSWFHILAQYMMTQQAPFVRRQVRKLLLYICGSKEKYRQLRDMHALQTHMDEVHVVCDSAGLDTSSAETTSIILPYDVLIELIEHLTACSEIATSHTVNWQKFCQKEDGVLPFLIHASIVLHSGVVPVLLQLLQCALCGSRVLPPTPSSSSSPSKQKRERERKEEEADDSPKHDEALCLILVQQVCKCVNRELLVKFIRCFLLESNSTNVRWQAHTLVLHIYRSSSSSQQEALLDLMWSIWPEVTSHGRKAVQFVDLLGYFTIKTPQISEKKSKSYVEKAVAILRSQNKVLANHPNGFIYSMLQGLVDFDGYYLESDPCLVCNNPEVPYANIKLSAIKVDSKSTTTTQIVKLVGSHTISKIILRITDLKRTKMVRTMNFYYNNRTVQAVVELKNKPSLWHKAKRIVLTAGQTEVKVDFPLPIVACNLMIEYVDFYDNLQATSETLQCPRCSASVPANPGVCSNCGENVFQCHKCRAINYDEKDPFLCNACGFCKYAKFDFTLTAKPCCAVDPIENEEDRKKAVSTINTLLEKADRLYRQLRQSSTPLATYLARISEHSADKLHDESSNSNVTSTGSGAGSSHAGVSRAIQEVVHQYCRDCKSTFEELSKIIQKIIASRKELVEYNRQQQEAALSAAAALPRSSPGTPVVNPRASEVFPKAREVPPCDLKPREKTRHCYGCASATVEHCMTLIRALAINTNLRSIICSQGLIRELLDYNLRRGTTQVRTDVRRLLCLLTRDNVVATNELNTLLTQRIITAIQGHLSNPDFDTSVRQEMLLLAATVEREDSCWELRVRCVLRLFLLSVRMQSPVVLDNISQPCLEILYHIIKPEAPTSKKHKDKLVDSLSSVKTSGSQLHVTAESWLSGDIQASFKAWRKNMPHKAVEFVSKKRKEERVKEEKTKEEKDRDLDRDLSRRVIHIKYLMEKYGSRWKSVLSKGSSVKLTLEDKSWLRRAMFSPASPAARTITCKMVEAMCQVPARKRQILDMLTEYLEEVGHSGESAAEFLALYKRLVSTDQHTPGTDQWKYYLAIKGVLTKIANLITSEIDNLLVLEGLSLSSDLSQGYSLKALTELLAMFVEQENIKQLYKNRLVGAVLNGYLSLRKLVIQRTKLIDETQDNLLDLLEEMTTGTESETKNFMAVCVETVNKYPPNDFVSPVFIFERLCSIIYPEENDVGEFFMSLDKDPQQEDFLQGRMLGNPYSSNVPALGPLMRDVKNKICQDCELVALLEDDTGMELLVCNKIISLDLPVKDVYKKIWLPEHGEGETMRIVYRMRGLLGDATEDMVNTLDTGKDEDVDKEEVYRMANVMAECGGLDVMLLRLSAVRDLVSGKQLMGVLLKLFSFCTMVKLNRQQLIKPDRNTISIMLGALNLALLAEQEMGSSTTTGQTLTEQILQVMETILQEASEQPPELYKEFSKLCSDKEQLMVLLDRINSPFVRSNASVLQALMRLIPFLAFGEQTKMQTLVNHFQPYLDFNRFDSEHNHDEQIHIDCFCVIANGIERNANGMKLRDLILEHGITRDALAYILQHAPPVVTLLATDSDDWKEFISKPGLPYALRLLTGLSSGHAKTQVFIGNSLVSILHKLLLYMLSGVHWQQPRVVPPQVFIGNSLVSILHKLEQVSSDEHIGSLAENLMETLKDHPEIAAKIEETRQQTKAEKKRLAMAMRQKQLGALGMMTNEKGQVTVKSSVLKQMEDIKEEAGLVCCICREGYRYQPTKVLGVYTYTKRMPLEEYEMKQRKTQGYSTVTHFNVIHTECHLAAVRHARGREECPSRPFASSLARHNTYLQECTGTRDASYSYTVHDLKLLLLKFAEEKSFSEDSGGGGRQSNIHLVPYLCHMALYVLNTTRSIAREEKNLNLFLKMSSDKWPENAFEVEGALYWAVMAVHVFSPQKWKQHRLMFLRRLIVAAQARHVTPSGSRSLPDKAVKPYSVYKTHLVFFAVIDGLFSIVFKKCSADSDSVWAVALADYIRANDQSLLESSDKLLAMIEEEVLPCESFHELCDVLGLLEEIDDPDKFFIDALAI
ncbi:E3 ubiquitin-protein ligase UBR4 [Lamellibrachia satsuma]|nr:E3 ubiquitin-protein ligase UBR4 [Lamellibrachia satsuma]